MYQRDIAALIKNMAKFYPIVGITGPRQSGKTTLAKILFKHLPYVSLENIDIRVQALNDPRAFLNIYAKGAIFDEIQHTPDILSYLQEVVDRNPQKGRYILTGPQNFTLNQHITQSLSGRIGMATLLPLSLSELGTPENSWEIIFKGGYPGLHHRHMHPSYFYPSYIQTYLERDVRQLKNIANYELFQNFIRLCAGRVGQVMNAASLAQDCGISHTTARHWLNTLKASYIVFSLPPYYQNFSKRLIKMPKIYFYDTGLACALLGIEQVGQLDTHYLRGALFENLVILEYLKHQLHQGLPAHLYFWRDRTGHEVDLLVERGDKLHAIEIKAGATFQKNFISNIQYLYKIIEKIQGYVIYNGEQMGSYANTSLVPIKQLKDILP
ncbi:MAG: ATP-binding protein [Bacteroidota bacterium]